MSDVSDRAEDIASRPEVRRWIKRFRKLAAEMPPDVWVFVAAGTPCVVATGEDGRPIEGNGGMDQDALIDSVIGGEWGGGDW